MSLNLPTVSVTVGPAWASEINTALTTIDSHDHSSGKGTKVKTSGLDINLDLSFNTNRAKDLQAVQLTLQNVALSGASNALSVYAYQNNLYYTNGAGTAVQITAGAALAATPGNAQSFNYEDLAADITISPASTSVFFGVDTTAPRSVTLPLASAVAAGRIFVIKDASGLSETNTLTIAASGADTIDGAISVPLESNYGSWIFMSNGANAYYRF